ncbi:hypothetical protein BJ878DRAFT_476132 [Calycina marina]|uniref:Uncharacterized protein n=1 Tax=Calycina marina TaxID=1763456 RepID=A0A9P7ZC30_9HELO|nr:hypothetical protein BJ878DRAFT_476132 [Calycina marina]
MTKPPATDTSWKVVSKNPPLFHRSMGYGAVHEGVGGYGLWKYCSGGKTLPCCDGHLPEPDCHVLVLIGAYFAVVWGLQIATHKVYAVPGLSLFDICGQYRAARPTRPMAYRGFEKGLKYIHKLGYVQGIGAKAAALPYHLQKCELSARDLVIKLSATELPRGDQLMQLLEEYRDFTDDLVEVFHSLLSRGRDSASHLMAMLIGKHNQAFGVNHATEDEIRESAFQLIAEVKDKAGSALVEAEGQLKDLYHITAILDRIGGIATKGRYDLEQVRGDNMSKWRWIMCDLCPCFTEHT